jgi:hypothetical protein
MNRHTAARLTTGRLNTVRDILPGSLVQNNTGVAQFQGLLTQKYRFDAKDVARHWDTTLSAAPLTDLEVQYIQVKSDAPVAPARGVLAFWSNKKTGVVTTDDTLGLDYAGVFMGTMAAGEYGYIVKVGEIAMKFVAGLTKAAPVAGDTAVSSTGQAGLADVELDATAQTYGTDRTNIRLGTLRSAVAAQIATVEISVVD